MKEDCKKCPCPLIRECGQRPIYEEALKDKEDILDKIEDVLDDINRTYLTRARLIGKTYFTDCLKKLTKIKEEYRK